MSSLRYTVEIADPNAGVRPMMSLCTRMPYNTGHMFGAGDARLEVIMNTDAKGMPWGGLELSITNFTAKYRRTTHKSLDRAQVAALRDWCQKALDGAAGRTEPISMAAALAGGRP